MTGPATDIPLDGASADPSRSFERLAWITLAFTVAVILFGAYVRISGSGAGCGQHWPTCNGEIIHLPRTVQTAIELTHRVTSGTSLLLVVALLVWARRSFAPGHVARGAASAALVFMIGEALIGAVLVKLDLVGHNASVARAVVMGLHLVNTWLLTGSLAVAAWAASRPTPRRWTPSGWDWLLALGLCAAVIVAMLGAVTALGDTLFPVAHGEGVMQRLADDQGVAASFLQRARIYHPLFAVIASALVLYLAPAAAERHDAAPVRRLSQIVIALVIIQVAGGVLNIVLSAPGWMQLAHLALANALWIALVLLYTASRAHVTSAA